MIAEGTPKFKKMTIMTSVWEIIKINTAYLIQPLYLSITVINLAYAKFSKLNQSYIHSNNSVCCLQIFIYNGKVT